jgi:hypothetical protein
MHIVFASNHTVYGGKGAASWARRSARIEVSKSCNQTPSDDLFLLPILLILCSYPSSRSFNPQESAAFPGILNFSGARDPEGPDGQSDCKINGTTVPPRFSPAIYMCVCV